MDSAQGPTQTEPTLCSLSPFWNPHAGHDKVALSAVKQCSAKGCASCPQFVDFLKTILGREWVTGNAVFKMRPEDPWKELDLWDITPKEHVTHVETIQIVRPGIRPSIPPSSRKTWLASISSMSKESIQRFVGWTGEDSALKLVKSWLKNCANNHTDCDRYQPTSLPDRVLDVSGDALKLYESSNEDYSYTALSHCWGKTKAKCTTYRANLETQKKEIAWDALPRTFQEAVKVTRALGIKYIWIDSICIVQDDPEDWRQQAAKMAAVYSRSYVTIAATASDSDDGGCFRYATNDLVGHVINVTDGFGPVFDIRLRAEPRVHYMSMPLTVTSEDHDSWKGLGEQPPLFLRAWCYQERQLSPRLLRFDESEISWSCRSIESCSCGHLDRVSVRKRLDPREAPPFLLRPDERRTLDIPLMWHGEASRYGNLSLTHEKDKLAAIAAIAEKVWSTFRKEDTYLAGLWRNSLIVDMLWSCPQNERPVADPRPFPGFEGPKARDCEQDWRAPTWSWASCNGKTSYMYGAWGVSGSWSCLTRILDVCYNPVKDAPFAQFHKGAYVVLSGATVFARLTSKFDDSGAAKFRLDVVDSRISRDTWLEERECFEFLPDIPIKELLDTELVIHRLASYLIAEKWMVLRQASDKVSAYERVGIASFRRRALLFDGQGALDIPEQAVKIF